MDPNNKSFDDFLPGNEKIKYSEIINTNFVQLLNLFIDKFEKVMKSELFLKSKT